jgi:ankyrin repeat protein
MATRRSSPFSLYWPTMPAFAPISALAQTHARALRNLANSDELNAWLEDLLAARFGPAHKTLIQDPASRPAACEKWLSSVARKWMMRHGQAHAYAPKGAALLQSPAWVQAAVASGAPPQRLALADSERQLLSGILDWLASDAGPALGLDWSRVSVEQALAAEQKWIDAMGKEALKKDLEAADAAGTSLFAESPAPGPDGRSGWRWTRIHSPEALDREGALMRHCVGSYAKEVADESKGIYSLRDPDNQPRLTLETQQGTLVQLKAFANAACPPELFSRVADFTQAFEPLCEARGWKMDTKPEMEHSGVVSLPGLGFGLAGSPASERLAPRLADALSGGNAAAHANALLPALAAMGWMDQIKAALPLADQDHRNQALVRAATNGRLSVVEFLLPVCDPKAKESLALSAAANNGHLDVVALLLPVSDPKAKDSLALKGAAYHGHAAVAELLLPVSDPKADNSWALLFAANNGHLGVVELMLPVCDPEARNFEVLQWAAAAGQLAVVEGLLRVYDPKAHDSAALRSAALKGQAEVVERLLPVSEPKAKNSEALQWAASKGHLAVMKLLLPFSDPKANDSAALHWGVEKGRQDMVELLLPVSDLLADGKAAAERANFCGFLGIAELIEAATDKRRAEAALGEETLGDRLRARRASSTEVLSGAGLGRSAPVG